MLIAAPTSSCFLSSLLASGKFLLFFKSVLAMRATSSSFSLTIGSLPEGNGDKRDRSWKMQTRQADSQTVRQAAS